MNGIFICYSPLQLKLIQPVIEDVSWQKLWLVFSKQKRSYKGKTKNITWLALEDMIHARYPLPPHQLIPLDEEILETMSHTQVTAMEMMSRMTFDGQLPYQQRYEQYLDHLRFWRHILITQHIDHVVFGSIPHEIYDFILYDLCQHYEIPASIMHQNRVYDSVLLMEDWQNSMEAVRTRFHELQTEFKSKSMKHVSLSPHFQRQLEAQTKSGDGFKHFNMSKSFSARRQQEYLRTSWFYVKRHWRELLKRFFHPADTIKTLMLWSASTLKAQQLNGWLQQHTITPNLDESFVYFPLHLQPECTTSPMAGRYTDQKLMVEMIHHVLPKEVKIYVKEHPVQDMRFRSAQFYRDILKYPQVRLINDAISSRELITHSQAVVTATGTAGWEALFLEKPVFMFGHDSYQYMPGVFPIHALKDAQAAVQAVFTRHHHPRLKDVTLYLKAMDEVLIKGYCEEYYQPFSSLSEAENIVSISTAIKEKLTHA